MVIDGSGRAFVIKTISKFAGAEVNAETRGQKGGSECRLVK